MAGLINLPGYNPGPGINFQPIQNALSQVNESAQFNRQNALAQEQLGMQKERFGMEKQQFETQQKEAAMRRFATHAGEVDGIQDPTQRKSAWDRLLATHPDSKSIPLNYWDPMNGPKMVLREAEGFMGEKDRAQIGLIQANTQKALREAAEAGGGYGKEIKPYQTADGKIWGVQAGAQGNVIFHDLSNPGSQPLVVPRGGMPQGGPPAMGQQPAMPQGGAPVGTPGVRPNALAPQATPRPSGPLTPFRGVKQVGGDLVDLGNGRTVRSVEDAITRGETAKGEGELINKLTETLPKARSALESANAKVDIVRSKIAEALPKVSQWTTGYGAVLDRWPSSAALDFKGTIDTIVANLGFDELQEMRNNSPTGGALGAVVVEELRMLQATKVSLERAQSPAQVTKSLQDLNEFYVGKPKIGPDDIPVIGPDGKIVREGGAVERRQRAFEETYAPLRQRRTGNSHEVTGPRVPRQFGDRLPTGAPPQPGVQGTIPPQSVRLLQSDPSPQAIQEFEARYGPGSARQFMGGQ